MSKLQYKTVIFTVMKEFVGEGIPGAEPVMSFVDKAKADEYVERLTQEEENDLLGYEPDYVFYVVQTDLIQ